VADIAVFIVDVVVVGLGSRSEPILVRWPASAKAHLHEWELSVS